MPKLLLPRISWIIGLTTCILIASLLLLHPHVGVAEEEQVLLVERHVSGDIAYNAFFDTRSQAVYGGVTYDYLSTRGVEATLHLVARHHKRLDNDLRGSYRSRSSLAIHSRKEHLNNLRRPTLSRCSPTPSVPSNPMVCE